MSTKIRKYTGILLMLGCVACGSLNKKETPSGMEFTVVKAGDGTKPKSKDVVVFEMVMKDSKDSIWGSTYEQGIPSAVMIADSTAMATENGMLQMFRMSSKGDSLNVNIPIAKFFRDVMKSPLPPGIDTTTNIIYNIKVTDIMDVQQFQVYQIELMQKRQQMQKAKDASTIEKYLADNKIEAQSDTSGIRYVIHNRKGGNQPTASNCVSVNYRGKFLKDGAVFDQGENVSFSLEGVIPGWRIGIPLLGIGDSATFYIPSALAYGPQGYPGAIPPDAILIFDVTLIGFAEGFDEATRTCK